MEPQTGKIEALKELPDQIRQYHQRSSELQERTTELEKRLQPVLRLQEEKEPSQTGIERPGSKFASEICTANEQIDQVLEKLAYILRHLEL